VLAAQWDGQRPGRVGTMVRARPGRGSAMDCCSDRPTRPWTPAPREHYEGVRREAQLLGPCSLTPHPTTTTSSSPACASSLDTALDAAAPTWPASQHLPPGSPSPTSSCPPPRPPAARRWYTNQTSRRTTPGSTLRTAPQRSRPTASSASATASATSPTTACDCYCTAASRGRLTEPQDSEGAPRAWWRRPPLHRMPRHPRLASRPDDASGGGDEREGRPMMCMAVS
jgi:hypothetical protein